MKSLIQRTISLLLTAAVLFGPSEALASTEDAFTSALAQGPVYAALAALVGGLLVSFTPCVYPMVAVTVSVFGARETRSKMQGAALSAVFVLGIVAMFVPLGVAAGLTGSMFGSILQNRWVIVGISLLFVAMAVSLFGAFEFALPSSLTNRLASIGGLGYKGAFLLGLACGVIAAPCTGPVLTGILTWIAKTQNVTLGVAAMTAFALGLGAPFFVVGTFAVQLPKSGSWMVHVKSLLGIVLLVVALYFLNTAFPSLGAAIKPGVPLLAGAAVVLLIGLALGAVHRDFAASGTAGKLAKGTGIALTTLAAFALVIGLTKPTRSLHWEATDVAVAKAKALSEQRPLLIDFTATWCVACKELDKLTFADPLVAQEAGRFVAVKVDATNDDDPRVEEVLEEYGVVGLPTVLLYDSSGKETIRYTDFVPADQFLQGLRKVN